MGLFEGVFGTKRPQLAADSAAARAIDASEVFAEFAKSANDKMEVVPGEDAVYVFVGKPPKAFGIVWFADGQRFDVRTLMESGAMGRESAARLVQELATVYEQHASDTRFEYKAGGHRVVVTPSAEMYDDVAAAIARAMP